MSSQRYWAPAASSDTRSAQSRTSSSLKTSWRLSIFSRCRTGVNASENAPTCSVGESEPFSSGWRVSMSTSSCMSSSNWASETVGSLST